MRLTVQILGFELDITLGRADNEPLSGFDEYQDAGYTGSYPISFTRPHIPWDADGPIHQFEPSEADED